MLCLENCFIWRRDLDTRKLERQYLDSFELLCSRRKEKLKWSVKVTNEKLLEHIEENRVLLNNVLCRKANWIGCIQTRTCLHGAIEGQMMELKGVGRRR